MKTVASLLLGLAAAATAVPAAAGTLEDIRKRGEIRLGFSLTKAPFSFEAKDDGQPAGFSVELCKRVAVAVVQHLKLPSTRIRWVALDPATRIEAVAAGKVDLECGTTTPTISRRARVGFSLPIYADAATLMGRSASAISLGELQGKRIAVTDGTTTVASLERALRARKLQAEVVRTNSLAGAFDLLKAGGVEAIAGDRTALVGTFLLGGGGEGFSVFAEDIAYEPYALVMRKGDERFRLLVDSVLSGIYRSGEIDAIYTAWLAPLGRPTPALVALYLLNALPD